jgi:large subunit ribosomal protein L18
MDTSHRSRRHARIRARLHGTATRPRASVFRSARRITVQLIDDEKGSTLVAVEGQPKRKQNKTDQAKAVGVAVAAQAKKAGIRKIVFDRGGYQYQGRVKAVADAMREGGLEF